MGDGVGVPALGEHRHRHDAADLLAELALLADGVHHLAQQVLVGELVDVGAGVAPAVLVLERLDLVRGGLLEVALSAPRRTRAGRSRRGSCAAGSSHAPSSTLRQQREVAGREHGPCRRRRSTSRAGDPVEDELRDDGVRADDDDHRRRLAERARALVASARTPAA